MLERVSLVRKGCLVGTFMPDNKCHALKNLESDTELAMLILGDNRIMTFFGEVTTEGFGGVYGIDDEFSRVEGTLNVIEVVASDDMVGIVTLGFSIAWYSRSVCSKYDENCLIRVYPGTMVGEMEM